MRGAMDIWGSTGVHIPTGWVLTLVSDWSGIRVTYMYV